MFSEGSAVSRDFLLASAAEKLSMRSAVRVRLVPSPPLAVLVVTLSDVPWPTWFSVCEQSIPISIIVQTKVLL